MNCMKCGRETAGTDVFCEKCLAAIERYPVKPGTHVHLPKRTESTVQKRKRLPSAEEIIAGQRLKLRRRKLAILILVLLLLLCLAAIALLLISPPQESILAWLQPLAESTLNP